MSASAGGSGKGNKKLSNSLRSAGGGGFGSRALQAFRSASRRVLHGIIQGTGRTCTPSGLAKICALHGLLASVLLGAKKCAKLWAISLASMLTFQTINAARTQPEGDIGTAFLKGISGGNVSSLSVGLVQVMDIFDKVFDTFPQLRRPRISALRDAAPCELLLRFMTATSIHMRMAPHPDSDEAAPRDFMGPQPDGGKASKDEDDKPPGDEPSEAGAHHVGAEDATEGSLLEGYRGMIDVQSAAAGEPAPKEDLDELRRWLPWAEATYYEFSCYEAIDAWLTKEGCQLVYAQLEATPSSAAHCLAYHEGRKQVFILVRGTETMSDAITDMVVTPELWGDEDHSVHSGIGDCADKIFARTRGPAAAFHANGYSVMLIGHSMGAAVAALVAWRFKKHDKLECVRAVGYACPPSASPAIARECEDFALLCVMRYDVIPRISPKTVVAMEEELLNITWHQMEVTCKEWGKLGKMLYKRAWKQSRNTQEEQQELEEKYRQLVEEKTDSSGNSKESKPSEEEGGGGGGGGKEAGQGKENQGNGSGNGADEESGSDGGGEGGGGEGGDAEGAPNALMNPTVPGKIVWLRPANKFAIMFGGDDKDLRREGIKGSEDEEKQKYEQMSEQEWLQQQSDMQEFDPRVIPADAATMCTVRLAQQSMTDHYLSSYRCGLRMPVRMEGQTQKCPSPNEKDGEEQQE